MSINNSIEGGIIDSRIFSFQNLIETTSKCSLPSYRNENLYMSIPLNQVSQQRHNYPCNFTRKMNQLYLDSSSLSIPWSPYVHTSWNSIHLNSPINWYKTRKPPVTSKIHCNISNSLKIARYVVPTHPFLLILYHFLNGELGRCQNSSLYVPLI